MLESNLVRGKRTLFFMRAFLLTAFLIAVLGGAAAMSAPNFSGTWAELASVTAFAVASFILLFLLFVFGLVLLVYWMAWLHRAEKNLRIIGSTEFLPALAVICTCIPFLGPLIHFFIFHDLVEQQHALLEKNGIFSEKVSGKFQVLWIVAGILSILFTFLGEVSNVLSAGSYVFFLVATLSYLRCFEVFIRQEDLLIRFCQDKQFQKKVDEAIRNREILKAASQVEQAKFD